MNASGAHPLLQNLSSLDDDQLDLAPVALALSSYQTSTPYAFQHYLAYLGHLVSRAKHKHPSARAYTACERAEVLRSILVDREGYQGETEASGHPDGANLLRVIDRRKGLSISLGILYLHIARHMRWPAFGLNFPGCFLIRLSGNHEDRIILDPSRAGIEVSAPDLRSLYKSTHGCRVELHPRVYTPISNRDILLRLQTYIRQYALQNEDYPTALAAIEKMLLIAPSDFKLWREKGLLYMRLCKLDHAITALEYYLSLAPSSPDRDVIAQVMDELHRDHP